MPKADPKTPPSAKSDPGPTRSKQAPTPPKTPTKGIPLAQLGVPGPVQIVPGGLAAYSREGLQSLYNAGLGQHGGPIGVQAVGAPGPPPGIPQMPSVGSVTSGVGALNIGTSGCGGSGPSTSAAQAGQVGGGSGQPVDAAAALVEVSNNMIRVMEMQQMQFQSVQQTMQMQMQMQAQQLAHVFQQNQVLMQNGPVGAGTQVQGAPVGAGVQQAQGPLQAGNLVRPPPPPPRHEDSNNFKTLDSKLIPQMPVADPSKWTTRPAEILGFAHFIESLTSWLSTLQPAFSQEIKHVMQAMQPIDESVPGTLTAAEKERSTRLFYVLKQALGSTQRCAALIRCFESANGLGSTYGYALLQNLKSEFSITTRGEGLHFRSQLLAYRVKPNLSLKDVIFMLDSEFYSYDRILSTCNDQALVQELRVGAPDKYRWLILNLEKYPSCLNYVSLHCRETYDLAKQGVLDFYQRTVLNSQDFKQINATLSSFNPGGSQFDGDKSSSNKEKDPKDLVCFKCGKKGHFAKHCKSARSASPAGSNGSRGSQSSQKGKGKGKDKDRKTDQKGQQQSHAKGSKNTKKQQQYRANKPKGYRAAEMTEENENQTEEQADTGEDHQDQWSEPGEPESELRLSMFLESAQTSQVPAFSAQRWMPLSCKPRIFNHQTLATVPVSNSFEALQESESELDVGSAPSEVGIEISDSEDEELEYVLRLSLVEAISRQQQQTAADFATSSHDACSSWECISPGAQSSERVAESDIPLPMFSSPSSVAYSDPGISEVTSLVSDDFSDASLQFDCDSSRLEASDTYLYEPISKEFHAHQQIPMPSFAFRCGDVPIDNAEQCPDLTRGVSVKQVVAVGSLLKLEGPSVFADFHQQFTSVFACEMYFSHVTSLQDPFQCQKIALSKCPFSEPHDQWFSAESFAVPIPVLPSDRLESCPNCAANFIDAVDAFAFHSQTRAFCEHCCVFFQPSISGQDETLGFGSSRVEIPINIAQKLQDLAMSVPIFDLQESRRQLLRFKIPNFHQIFGISEPCKIPNFSRILRISESCKIPNFHQIFGIFEPCRIPKYHQYLGNLEHSCERIQALIPLIQETPRFRAVSCHDNLRFCPICCALCPCKCKSFDPFCVNFDALSFPIHPMHVFAPYLLSSNFQELDLGLWWLLDSGASRSVVAEKFLSRYDVVKTRILDEPLVFSAADGNTCV